MAEIPSATTFCHSASEAVTLSFCGIRDSLLQTIGGPVVMRFTTVLTLALVACSDDTSGRDMCIDLKAEARELKAGSLACSADEACVLVTIHGDCTGVLACPFAVASASEANVKKQGARIAKESESCTFCARPECATVKTVICNAAKGVCEAQYARGAPDLGEAGATVVESMR